MEAHDQSIASPLSSLRSVGQARGASGLIDRVLESRYRIDREVGRGGMGVVYRGTDLTLSRPVAIKTILHQKADEETLHRFIQEAKTLAQIEHPRLVPVYAVGQDEGYHYLVMKFLEGETLADKLKREGALSPQITRQVIQEVCEALNALHVQGLVHRDLKPANLMISPTGGVTVMDLGIAKRIGEESNTSASIALGTPRYMPPEAVDGNSLDTRADIYSLGIIAYQMLVGELPFDGPTPMAILYKQAHQAPPLIRERAPSAPRNLETAVDIALQKSPENRFQSASEMSRAFDPSAAFTNTRPKHFNLLMVAFITGLLGMTLALSDVFHWRSVGSDKPSPADQLTDRSSGTQRQKGRLGSPNRAQTGSQTAAQTGSQTGSQGSQTESQTGSQTAAQTGSQTGSQTAPKAGSSEAPNARRAQTKSKAKAQRGQKRAVARAPAPPKVMVQLTISSVPSRAQVIKDRKVVGRTPYVVTKPRGEAQTYTLRLKGFHSRRITLKNRSVKASLKSRFKGF